MNPPAALQGAMGRERKPFTYTPGGLNLSEIKSERMAKRLMRNAMNEGVPQMPVQNIQSPTTPTTPLNVPNFNCLPVQVFPAFSLPANPKSLLRTRSTTSQPRDTPSAFNQQNSFSTLPSTGAAKFRQNNDTQNQGVVNHSGMNRESSLCTQLSSYLDPAPPNDVNVQEKYTPYQFDTFKPGTDAVFMDTCADKGQRPAPMYSYINNPMQNQNTITKRVVPPFQYNPTPQSNDELRADNNTNIDTHSKYRSLPSYINYSVSDTNSMPQKPPNLYEFNVISNNSSQESYKTIESDGDQPNTLCSNLPSYINPQVESDTPKEQTSILSNSVSVQGNKDASEVQRLQEKYIFDDEEDTMMNERLYIDENKKPRGVSPELEEEEANVCIQPIDKESTSLTGPKSLVLNVDSQVPGECIALDNEFEETKTRVLIQPLDDNKYSNHQTMKFQDGATVDQSEVRVVKKVKKEKQTEETKQAENGDESETALTVKLPTKKSAAKTETKVEVKQKVLPDGTIEEIKKTITKTTIDGRTEISTRTETRTIPKDEQDEEEVEEEENEDEEEIEDNVVVVEAVKENGKEPQKKITNGQATIVKKEEKSETTTTKKVVVVQNNTKEDEEQNVEEEEEEEEEEIEEIPEKKEQKPVEVKPQPPSSKPPPIPVELESEEEELVEEEEERQVVKETVQLKKQVSFESNVNKEKTEDTVVKVEEKEVEVTEDSEKEDVEEEEEEEYEEAEEKLVENEVNVETKSEPQAKPEPAQEEEDEYTEEEVESEDEASKKATTAENKESKEAPQPEEPKPEPTPEPKEEPAPKQAPEPQKVEVPQKPIEIPIHLDKVDDFEIKPIGPQESISKTEKTEITTSKDSDGNAISTKTEMHRIENVVVSNRVTKTLDQSYEQLTQGLPTMKTYFAPSRERVDISPAKAYQPTYQQPEPTTERRHSLLLERLSMERQMPSPGQYQNQTYQSYNNQSYEARRDLSQEPQSEVVNLSNVKPSTITKNQQWYQNKDENAIYNNVSQTPAPQQWSQPSPQPQYQAPAPPQPQYQAPAQPIYQSQHQPSQPQAQTYTDNYNQSYSKDTQSTYQQNSYPSYTPQPTPWGSNNVDSSVISNQYAYKSQDQSSTQQQYSSSYVPPPWEQDASYVAPPTNTKYFQPPPLANEFQTNSSVPGWKPAPPAAGKFSKPAPKAYVPPAPNQSFVKPVTVSEPPKNLPGRKTYYSEYERRYISVPESTYVPAETKYQQQPDPSPQYYYDNDEVPEKVEPEWRRELREFTEKTSQTYSSDKGTQSQYQSQTQTQYQTEQGTQSQYQSQYQTETSARPPWESDAQYAKTPVNYTPTPTWSQTLRPNSGRERTFESDYVSQTSTLGRNRPLSYVETNSNPLPGRTRGVSVDRYNPSSYRSPIPTEHSPVQSHTLNPATAPPPKIYHNPSVPAYHSRASAEPREQPAQYPQPRHWVERASPLQSRSFKYLQWITGTDE